MEGPLPKLSLLGLASQNPFLAAQSTDPILSVGLEIAMAGVIQKFVTASLFMWITPVAILYAFNNNLLPGASDMSPYSLTLLSGFLAVISVNIVIAFYIYMAMKEPSDKHKPDPAFLAEAKASVSQPTGEADSSSQSSKKEE
ncbi:hypothetical protein L3X38_022512 [Prunus dulcis]|uniref:Vacuolar ATPase assembly integral membrane protein VMA21 homolog n=1 Tax=Prunus dulcis TaxID=3755 RepID=A0AAD4VXB0_PRUDU|nr:hypothetical protein L3X38_022512 [Prunus dulcis]